MRKLLALTVALALWPEVSHAEPTSEPSEFGVTAARERFKRGVEFFREGSFDAAYAEFSKAYELAPTFRLLYNLAQVQSERHDYVAALKLFDDYLRQGGSEISAERRKQVESSMAQLKSRVAALWVQSPVAGAELSVDGVPAGALPLNSAVLVNAGVHQLQLRKDGYDSTTRVLTIAGNETVRIELSLIAQRTAAESSAQRVFREAVSSPAVEQVYPLKLSPVAKAEVSRAPLWISFIATAALTGGAVTFGLLARSADDELDRQLSRYPADRAAAKDARDRVTLNAALCDGLAAGAVVAAGLALYFALSAADDETAKKEAARRSRWLANARGLGWVQSF